MKNRFVMKFFHFICCLLLLCLLLPNASAQAQAPLLDTVIVAVSPTSPPFVDEASDGNLVGFDVDIFKNLVRLSGLRMRYEKTNFSYIIPGVATQLYDVAIGCLFVSDARREVVNFTNPYFTTGLVLVIQANNETLRSQTDLTSAVRVSVKQGTAAETYARQKTQARIQAMPSAVMAMQQLADHSADAVIIDEMIAKAFMTVHPDLPLRIVGFLTIEQCAFAVNKSDSALLTQLNQALVRLKNSRQYDNIYRKWFGDRPITVEPMLQVTSTVTTTITAPVTPVVTSTVQIASSITPTKQWAGVYYLTAQAISPSTATYFSSARSTPATNVTTQTTPPDAATIYQIITLTPDGIWSGTEMLQSSAPLTASQAISGMNGTLNQQGAWQANATGHITATVLSFQSPSISPASHGLQRLQYQLAIEANGAVTGQYTVTPYPLGDNPLVATLTTTQTQTLSVTGQRVKP